MFSQSLLPLLGFNSNSRPVLGKVVICPLHQTSPVSVVFLYLYFQIHSLFYLANTLAQSELFFLFTHSD